MKFRENFQFKFIIVEPNYVKWEGSENRTFDYNTVKHSQKCVDFEPIYDKINQPRLLRLKCEWRNNTK